MRAALLLLAVVSCGASARRPSPTAPAPAPARALDPAIPGWLPANRDRLDALLASRGRGSPGYDAAHPPVATFDWDNTMMRNDIGDTTMAWMLRHDAILQPPGRDWGTTSGALTDAARRALQACDAAGEPGRPLATAENPACADAIFGIYDAGRVAVGAAAWTRAKTLTVNEPSAWLGHLLAGHTPAEVRAFARAAYEEASRAPVGARQTIGSRTDVEGYVRIYAPMRDLVGALQARGFDVWVISASPQQVLEAIAGEVGIAGDHVVGVRNELSPDGRLGVHLESCGGAPPDSVIPYGEGKRCFINKIVFHQPAGVQLARADEAHRQVFAAGDADTDVVFVQDATALKLVIDRHQVQLMCNAYTNAGGRWLVQPMFIEPVAPQAAPYPCSTALDADGQPIVDELGRRMTDQTAP